MKETKGVFFPSNKKLYEDNMFKNSEEFKQLGTMHIENRAADYFPLDKPQPASLKKSPLAAIKMEQVMANAGKKPTVDLEVDPDKSRSAHIK